MDNKREIPAEAVMFLRDQVNAMGSKPALDKHSFGISGMDSKYIIRELLAMIPNALAQEESSRISSARRALLRSRVELEGGPETPEEHVAYLTGVIESALQQLGA